MKLLHTVAICALLISAPSHAGSAARAKKAVAAAISDPARPADDVKRDDARKPADILEFAQVKPRDMVRPSLARLARLHFQRRWT